MIVKVLLKGCNRFCIYHICCEVIPVIDHLYAIWLAPDLTLGLLFVDFKSMALVTCDDSNLKKTAGSILSHPLMIL